MQDSKIKKIATLAMLSAVAYVVMLVMRVPLMAAAPFLKFDAKDVILCIAGFLYGPLEGAAVSLLVAVLEGVTVGSTGIWGIVMNFLSSAAFVCTAAAVYRKQHTRRGAVLGLLGGILAMTASMLLWNWLITPIYQGMPRAAVAKMLLPVFLPFNLLKSGINAVVTFLLYKPVAKALRRARLAPPSLREEQGER